MLSDELVFELSSSSNCQLVVFKDGRVVARILGDGYPYDQDITDSQLGQLLRPVLLKVGLLEADLLEQTLLEQPLTLRNVNVMRSNVREERNVTSAAGQTEKTLLRSEVTKTLRDGGIDPDVVRYLGSLNGCATALNTSTNPVKAAQTMIAKDTFRARFAAWQQKNSPAPAPDLQSEED